jgi:ubiquinone/menaquinone biosynthesis C-methylase UbiE
MNFPSHVHPVIHHYVNTQIKVIRERIQIQPNTKLLDVGCGNGYFSYYFKKICNVTGVDLSEYMLGMNPIQQKYCMDARNLHFRDNSFDIVFCHDMLHHADDTDAILKEMKRVASKYVVLVEPNRNNPLMFLLGLLMPSERQALKYSTRYLRKKVEDNGLKVIDSFAFGWMVPAITPTWMLSISKMMDVRTIFGWENFILCEKQN